MSRRGWDRTASGSDQAPRRRVAMLVTAAVVGVGLLTACGTTPTSSVSVAVGDPATAEPSGSGYNAAVGPGARAPAGFVALSDVDPTIVQDIRYATDHNFVGRPVAGYSEPLCLLTREAAERLRQVQDAARTRGYGVKVYDCYRPQRAVDDFVSWASRQDDQAMKSEFYPGVDKAMLFDDGYIGGPTTHSSGSTMDLTLVPLPTPTQRSYVVGQPLSSCTAPLGQRFADNTVDMGTGFDCFDARAHTQDSRTTGTAMANRLLLRQLMADAGFGNYAKEWWHYSLTVEPFPHQYFNFPVSRASLT